MSATRITRLQKLAAASSLVTFSSVAAFNVHQSSSEPNTSVHMSRRPSPFAPLATQILSCRFQKGDSYTWVYRRKADGSTSSWERYTVVQVQYPRVVLEMASKFAPEESYQTHHRITLNLEQQLNAVYSQTDWKLDKFEYLDEETEEWTQIGQGSNVQAFEEKFNVFVMPPNHWQRLLLRITAKPINSSTTVTQPLRHRYTRAWYGFQPEPLAGVAIWKDFGDYSFALIEQQRDGVKQVFDFGDGHAVEEDG